jgi:monoamine oxidase
VHFAPAERSSWPDSMEGALESGQRAAEDILHAPA